MRHLLIIFASLLSLAMTSQVTAEPFEADWDSLAQHEAAPEWFRDAKFGIYFHWGPYSVPAFGNEHYPRTMYGHPSGKKPKLEDNIGKFRPAIGFQSFREHDYHREHYGEPKDFEYHDLVPLFTAENFDAGQWAELFQQAGARFAGPVAEHHDGYAMWDSEWTPWNAMDSGPKLDITGEIATAIRARGMKLVTTFHHARAGRAPEGSTVKDQRRWHYYGREKYWERVDPAYRDSPKLQKMYGTMPWVEFLQMWNGKLEEVIDTYQPDLIWFDSWLDRIPEANRQEFAAYYLNAAKRWGKDVVITYKQQDLPQTLGVVDFEKGRLDKLTEFAWLTDDTIAAGPWVSSGSWSYTDELDIKPARELVHTLIDVVSKNGNLLLNISPRADGTIPQNQREALLEMGEWLRTNGEAIYSTRPFSVYGEGPKRMSGSGHFVQMSGDYNEQNIRFTKRGDTVYAIQMGWPGAGQKVIIRSLGSRRLSKREIMKVSLVGSDDEISWHRSSEGLLIDSPHRAPNNIAICYRIETVVRSQAAIELNKPDRTQR
jgi:alpha-L-fucosidase